MTRIFSGEMMEIKSEITKAMKLSLITYHIINGPGMKWIFKIETSGSNNFFRFNFIIGINPI